MFQFLGFAANFALGASIAFGLPVPDGTWPTSQGNVSFAEVYVVKSGEVFDGGMKTYDRSDITCLGQTESNGTSKAVFGVQPGATLKNVIIGTNQMEGVHCEMSDCTIENVWWEDVCEDALSIKGGNASSVSRVLGGGARYADDKRFLNVSNSYVDLATIQAQRVDPNVSIVMMNENFGDQAVLRNFYVKPGKENYTECASSFGVNKSGERPVILSNGPKNPVCQYSYGDVHVVESEQDTEQQQQQQQPQLQVQVEL
ncbi:hypothetical protein PR001_g19413 [Phytophthora rubi]|uniref:Probable pectate lyase F n=2 Tax=Phytophthora rubi TaxID=129364 RepID=A0A6A3JTA2_9STRA|nr:hypothetical protein PR001_g19413 [Phytophthora rubi]